MKKVYLVLAGLAIAHLSFGQKMEVALHVNSGFSRFGGKSASKSTNISISDTSDDIYVGSRFGAKAGLNYGGGVQTQVVTNKNLLLGMQVSAEQLRSRVEIDRITGFRLTTEGDGHVTQQNTFLNVQPYFGKRIKSAVADIDLTLGTDIGFGLKSMEKGEATDENGNTLTIEGEREKQQFDFRPRLGITAYRGPYGASVSYVHGLTNYTGSYDGSNPEVYMRVLRLGLLYRL
ncbi:hypothetical protein [Pontibacter vulgaris]|uniref:hypothetical protein n=1 Tax=Pontibacter vulgaris TaxID=2905679 RepID=UPI001FA6FA68|nr:hypothetical protein [Pontibacter vulgaris]